MKKYASRPVLPPTPCCKMQQVIYCQKKFTLYHCFDSLETLILFQQKNPAFQVIIKGNDKGKLCVEMKSLAIMEEEIEAKTKKQAFLNEWRKDRYLLVEYKGKPFILRVPISRLLFIEWKELLPNERVWIYNIQGHECQSVSLSDLE